MSAPDNREIEVKIAYPGDASAARALIESRGYRVSEPRILESDTLFDRPSGELRGSDQLLRLRRSGNIARVTYKGPPAPGRYKSREEIEFDVSNGDEFTLVLDRLGYLPGFRYQKYRSTFAAPCRSGEEEGDVTIDETPIGVFLELEGAPEWIDRTARKLGFSPESYITLSYTSLYQEYRRIHPAAPEDMTFENGHA